MLLFGSDGYLVFEAHLQVSRFIFEVSAGQTRQLSHGDDIVAVLASVPFTAAALSKKEPQQCFTWKNLMSLTFLPFFPEKLLQR